MKHYVLSPLAIFVTWTVIDAIAHRFLLSPLYEASSRLWRPFAEMSSLLVIIATLILVYVFIILYEAFIRPKSLTVGLCVGGLLGIALGTASGLGTYIHSPIPVALAQAWFVLGIVKGVAAGGILGVLSVESSCANR